MNASYKPITKEMAAAILSVSKRTIDNMIAHGALPAPTPIGRRVYWHPDVFYAHLDRRLGAPQVSTPSDSRGPGRPRASLS